MFFWIYFWCFVWISFSLFLVATAVFKHLDVCWFCWGHLHSVAILSLQAAAKTLGGAEKSWRGTALLFRVEWQDWIWWPLLVRMTIIQHENPYQPKQGWDSIGFVAPFGVLQLWGTTAVDHLQLVSDAEDQKFLGQVSSKEIHGTRTDQCLYMSLYVFIIYFMANFMKIYSSQILP